MFTIYTVEQRQENLAIFTTDFLTTQPEKKCYTNHLSTKIFDLLALRTVDNTF